MKEKDENFIRNHLQLCLLKIEDFSYIQNKSVLDLKTNEYFLCITYQYKNGYPFLCGQYINRIEWIAWEENRFLYIKKVSMS